MSFNLKDIDPRFNMGGVEHIKQGKLEHISHLLQGGSSAFTPPKQVLGRTKAVFEHLKEMGYFYTCEHCGWWCEALHWGQIEEGGYDLEVCEGCAEAIYNME